MVRPRSLWLDVALSLALVTIATVVLNGGLAWLILRQSQLQQRLAMAEQVGAWLATALAQDADHDDGSLHYRQTLSSLKTDGLGLVELYVVDRSLQQLASVRGAPPRTHDAGFRKAFFQRQPHSTVEGRLFSDSRVVVTTPVGSAGPPVAAVRLSLSAEGAGPLVETRSGFLFFYIMFSGLVITLSGFVLLRRRLVLPIQSLREGTARMARGDFQHRISIEGARELMDLNQSLNQMAGSLSEFKCRTDQQVRHLEEANTALAEAQESLIRSARLASVGQLAAGIAHEVGNPLAAVVGYLQILTDEDLQDQDRRQLLERISREVGRIHNIISGLLDYARPGPGRKVASPLAEILQDAVETTRYQPRLREVDVEVEVDEGLLVHVDPDRLHQVMVNLILNAADAMEGRGRVEIRGVLEPEGVDDGLVRISVRDTGPGIADELRCRLFDPFFTTKGPGEGMGLGLATSLAIVEQAGGTMEVGDHTSGGAVFSVLLPVGQRASATPSDVPAPGEPG